MTRKEAKAATAAKVLEAGRGVFETKGFDKATMRDIARAAGMSTGAIFSNYATKAALYEAAWGHKPINPEIGRCAIITLAQLVLADRLVGEERAVEMARVMTRTKAVLEMAGIDPSEESTG